MKTSVGKPNKSEKKNAEEEPEKQGESGQRKRYYIRMKWIKAEIEWPWLVRFEKNRGCR